MSRVIPLVVLAFAVGCDDGKSKAKEAVDKVDKVLDDLDADEAKRHLESAKAAVAKGLDAAEDCAWAARIADDVAKAAIEDPVKELKRICSFDAPLARATKAVASAEKARAELPEGLERKEGQYSMRTPITECSSDEWFAAKRDIEATSHAGDPRWTEVKARWAKVCPDAK